MLPELGEAYLQAGRPRDAQRWLGEVLKTDSEMPEAHFFLGLAYDALGNREEARRLLEQELELWPDHAGAREVLARWE